MSTDCAVCYVSDINFLLPTLVSSTGLRKFVPAHKADIYIYLIDEEARIPAINQVLKPYGIHVLPLDSRVYAGFDENKFYKTHVPPASLGRFFMEMQLPDSCKRIVYLDGDTWMRRDPSPLIEANVPEGKFAAIEDITSFRRNSVTPAGRDFRSYYRGLGLDRRYGYFNAGVFAASRNTWRNISSEAHAFFMKNTAACRVHDQSALNAVVGDRRLRLSLKWNFTTAYRYFNIETKINPHIYHFTRFPKPWMGECKPWEEIYATYQAALAPFAALDLPIKKLDAAAVDANNKLDRRKNVLLVSPLAARFVSTLMGMKEYERKAWL